MRIGPTREHEALNGQFLLLLFTCNNNKQRGALEVSLQQLQLWRESETLTHIHAQALALSSPSTTPSPSTTISQSFHSLLLAHTRLKNTWILCRLLSNYYCSISCLTRPFVCVCVNGNRRLSIFTQVPSEETKEMKCNEMK